MLGIPNHGLFVFCRTSLYPYRIFSVVLSSYQALYGHKKTPRPWPKGEMGKLVRLVFVARVVAALVEQGGNRHNQTGNRQNDDNTRC